VGLLALLGLDERPAELAGWDYIPAALARQIITTMASAEFRWVLCDDDGHAITAGITSARPHSVARATAGSGSERGIVELQLRADDAERLAAAVGTTHPEYRRIVEDILTQIGLDTVTSTAIDASVAGAAGVNASSIASGDVADLPAGTGAAVSADPATGRDATDDAYGRAGGGDRRRRSAGAWLRRLVQIRDRYCTHPACRAPARYTDQDHAIDYARGGLTTDANLGCCCRRHHRLKHCGGWLIIKPGPQVTVWISSLGHRYVHRAPPIMPALTRPRLYTGYPGESSTRLSCGCAGYCGCGPIMPTGPTTTPAPTSTPAPARPSSTCVKTETDTHDAGLEEIPPF
jgi:hypothetical protein